jgi:hypothetical protein
VGAGGGGGMVSTINKKKPVPREYILGMSLIFKILLF